LTRRDAEALCDLRVETDDAGHGDRDRKTEWYSFIYRSARIWIALHNEVNRHIRADDRRFVTFPATHEYGAAISLIAVRLKASRRNAQSAGFCWIEQLEANGSVALASRLHGCEPC
ncbi:hypothetical protein, partial [Erythrobacter donghaensis]